MATGRTTRDGTAFPSIFPLPRISTPPLRREFSMSGGFTPLVLLTRPDTRASSLEEFRVFISNYQIKMVGETGLPVSLKPGPYCSDFPLFSERRELGSGSLVPTAECRCILNSIDSTREIGIKRIFLGCTQLSASGNPAVCPRLSDLLIRADVFSNSATCQWRSPYNIKRWELSLHNFFRTKITNNQNTTS